MKDLYTGTTVAIIIISVLFIFSAGVYVGSFVYKEEYEEGVQSNENRFLPRFSQDLESKSNLHGEAENNTQNILQFRESPLELEISGNDLKLMGDAEGSGSLPFKGNADAPVTIIEFFDYQSTYCSQFFRDAFPEIRKNYIETGKVKFYVRHFPLSFHQYAEKSAEASFCANEQNKFWEYHDIIFSNQTEISDNNLKKWAEELGLNSEKFNNCFESEKYKELIDKDLKDGQTLKIQGLPMTFINGQRVMGAKSYEKFQEIIESKLSSK